MGLSPNALLSRNFMILRSRSIAGLRQYGLYWRPAILRDLTKFTKIRRFMPNTAFGDSPNMNTRGFGLTMLLVSLLIIMFLFVSGFYLLGGSGKGGESATSTSPIKKAQEVKDEYNKKSNEIKDYLNNF